MRNLLLVILLSISFIITISVAIQTTTINETIKQETQTHSINRL